MMSARHGTDMKSFVVDEQFEDVEGHEIADSWPAAGAMDELNPSRWCEVRSGPRKDFKTENTAIYGQKVKWVNFECPV